MGAGHCQWGGLNNRNICNMSVGLTAAPGGSVTHTMTDGRKARKYIRMCHLCSAMESISFAGVSIILVGKSPLTIAEKDLGRLRWSQRVIAEISLESKLRLLN